MTLLQSFYRVQKNGYLLDAQHFGKRVRLPAGGDVILDGPFPAKRDGVQEPKGRDRERDRTGRQTPILGQVELPGPDLGRPEMLWRFAKMASEPVNLSTCSR